MSSINVTTTYPTGGTLLPNAFVDYYMIKANGEYVKVYIYLLRMVSNGQKFNISCLADLLELTERDICRALKYWKKENLLDLVMDGGEIRSIKLLPVSTALTIDADDLMEPEKEEPAKIPAKETTTGTPAAKAKAVPALRTLTPSQLAQKNKDDKFSYLIYIAEMYIGRPLTANDLQEKLPLYAVRSDCLVSGGHPHSRRGQASLPELSERVLSDHACLRTE